MILNLNGPHSSVLLNIRWIFNRKITQKNSSENYYDGRKREKKIKSGKKRRELNSLNIYQQWTGSSIVRTVHMIQLQQNCNEYELMDTNNCRNHYRHNRIQCKWTWNLERNRTQNTSDERPKPGSMRANNNKNNKKKLVCCIAAIEHNHF